jgi:UDP-glucose 4-epimerase
VYPEPVTVIELAEMVKATIEELTDGKVSPQIEVIDEGLPSLFSQYDKNKFKVDIDKAIKLLGLKSLISPKESIRYIARRKEQGKHKR